jgi:hypothetical protein
MSRKYVCAGQSKNSITNTKNPPLILLKGIIMKSIKTLRFTKSVTAIAVAAAGIATNSIATIAPNVSGTPDDGMVCRSGYTGFYGAGKLTCSKFAEFKMDLACENPRFPTYVSRAAVANNRVPDGPNAAQLRNGLDICTRGPGPGSVNIGPTDTLVGLDQTTNGNNGVYEIAKVSPARLLVRLGNVDQQEASALGLSVSQVDTIKNDTQSTVTINTGAANITDQFAVRLQHYTFAVPASGGISTVPPTGPASTFVPRPLQ